MSDQNPYEKLGLTEDASFDEIQEAKGRLLQEHHGDQKLLETIEAAYDAILMDRLKMRQQGKIKVPERIRFPEKLAQPPQNLPPAPVQRSASWLQNLFDTPSRADIVLPAGLYLGLGTLSFFAPPTGGSTLQVVLAIGVGINFYLLNRKERRFGRAVLLTLAGLLVGVGLGTLLASVLPGAIPLGLTADQLATLTTLVILWFMSSFLR